jgi:TolB protein
MNWTPDGRIVYSTAVNGNADIWIVDSDGSNLRQVTDDPHADISPVISNDGTILVFLSNRSGSYGVWRMNIDGTAARELANLRDLSSPSISPDGVWVYFSAAESKTRTTVLWKVASSGGEPIQLTDKACFSPQISLDGRYILCHYPSKPDAGGRSGKLVPSIISSDGKSVVKQFSELDKTDQLPLLWTADGTGFSFVLTSKGVSNIWIQPVNGTVPEMVTDFRTDEIFRYRWSRDGSMLALEKGLKINDVMLIRDRQETY